MRPWSMLDPDPKLAPVRMPFNILHIIYTRNNILARWDLGISVQVCHQRLSSALGLLLIFLCSLIQTLTPTPPPNNANMDVWGVPHTLANSTLNYKHSDTISWLHKHFTWTSHVCATIKQPKNQPQCGLLSVSCVFSNIHARWSLGGETRSMYESHTWAK